MEEDLYFHWLINGARTIWQLDVNDDDLEYKILGQKNLEKETQQNHFLSNCLQKLLNINVCQDATKYKISRNSVN